MSDSDDANEPQTKPAAPEPQPAEQSQQQAPALPDETENADQYINWVSRTHHPKEIIQK